MRKKYLNNSKQSIVDKAFSENKDNVTLCGEEYHIYSPNFDSGNIKSNCNILNVEFEVMDTFDEEYLKSLEKELDYIKRMVNRRKNELSPTLTKYELHELRYRHGNRKLYSLIVSKCEYKTDIYGDEKLMNKEDVESYLYSDTKRYQEEIKERLEDVKERYKL